MRSLFKIMLVGLASSVFAGCSLHLVPEPVLDEEQAYGACNPLPCLRVAFDELEIVSLEPEDWTDDQEIDVR